MAAARIRIGTCSWADETLTKVWYPPGVRSAEERLRYYAERFDTVEVDATYYSLPTAEMTERWATRTPSEFLFHIKAFGMMTRHPVRREQLPPDLRDAAGTDERGRVDRPARELRAEVFARFHDALEPLRSAGKLGGILLQFPPYVVCGPAAFEYLEWAQEQLRGDEMLVEFRHRSWLEEENRGRVLSFLEARGMTYVPVDAPRTDARNVVPTVVATTTQTAYVRMLGRNAATWNVRGRSAAARFDYLYPDHELREWIEPLRGLSAAAASVFVMFNNNGRTATTPVSEQPSILGPAEQRERDWIAQAPTNALMLRRILKAEGLAVTDPAASSAK